MSDPGRVPATARIEPLAPEDVERVVELAREIWLEHYASIITIGQIEYMLSQRYEPALVRSELARADVWWDRLRVNGELAGFASYFLTGQPREMKLDKIYIHPRWQRHGYGGMLIARALEVSRDQGCDRLILAVNKNNHSAIGAYLKHGFRIAASVVKDIGGGYVMDDYIMEKAVGDGITRTA